MSDQSQMQWAFCTNAGELRWTFGLAALRPHQAQRFDEETDLLIHAAKQDGSIFNEDLCVRDAGMYDDDDGDDDAVDDDDDDDDIEGPLGSGV